MRPTRFRLMSNERMSRVIVFLRLASRIGQGCLRRMWMLLLMIDLEDTYLEIKEPVVPEQKYW